MCCIGQYLWEKKWKYYSSSHAECGQLYILRRFYISSAKQQSWQLSMDIHLQASSARICLPHNTFHTLSASKLQYHIWITSPIFLPLLVPDAAITAVKEQRILSCIYKKHNTIILESYLSALGSFVFYWSEFLSLRLSLWLLFVFVSFLVYCLLILQHLKILWHSLHAGNHLQWHWSGLHGHHPVVSVVMETPYPSSPFRKTRLHHFQSMWE